MEICFTSSNTNQKIKEAIFVIETIKTRTYKKNLKSKNYTVFPLSMEKKSCIGRGDEANININDISLRRIYMNLNFS